MRPIDNLDIMQDGSENIQTAKVPLYIVYGNLRDLSNMTALCHWHEDVELLLPVNGYLSYNVNGQQLFVKEGNAIFINSRQMHYGFSTDGTDCEYICVTFKPDLLCTNEEIRKHYILPILANPGFSHLLLEQDNPSHSSLLTLIHELFDAREQTMTVIGKLHELWQGLYSLSTPQQTTSADENIVSLKQMLEFIHTHYHEKISLKEIASSAGVCRSKCCTIFKNYIRTTPNNYLNSYRLEKSMELLRNSDLSMTEISYACGFHSPSYFTEIFRQYKGCTPTEFRKRAGEN